MAHDPRPPAQTFDAVIAHRLSTWFGAGYIARGPGTFAAITALPLHWALANLLWAEITLCVVLCVLGIWASDRQARQMDVEDPQIIVIDEVAGAMIALTLAAGHGIFGDILALGLFRLFDIFKPWPVNWCERASHRGTAIMLDDIAAGSMAGMVVFLF